MIHTKTHFPINIPRSVKNSLRILKLKRPKTYEAIIYEELFAFLGLDFKKKKKKE
jgi:hypothetical protein